MAILSKLSVLPTEVVDVKITQHSSHEFPYVLSRAAQTLPSLRFHLTASAKESARGTLSIIGWISF